MPRPRQTEAQRAAAGAEARRRILDALAGLVAQQGFAATTVDDVARAAKVSKTTLYAQFTDRDAMLLALYDGLTDAVLQAIEAVDDPLRAAHAPWQERITSGSRAFLAIMLSGGGLSRSMLVEVPAVGEAGLAARRAVLDRYVDLLDERIHEEARRAGLGVQVPRDVLVAVVGGIHELVLRAAEQESPDVDAAGEAAERLLLGALGLLAPPPGFTPA